MSINITLDLYHPDELRAFAAFLTATASFQETRHKSNEADKLNSIGGISGMPSDVWKTYSGETGDGEKTADPVVGHEVAPGTVSPARKRGEPSPGHKRRTKVEIAEDAAAEANALAESGYTEEAAVVMEQAGISTGESRVGPDDEPAVEQQDVADEADETAKAGAELSHDDVRNAMGQYVTKFGMDAAQIDIPKVFQLALKDTAVTKVSLIPGDQASLKKVVDGVMEMLAINPFSRDAVA